MTENPAFDDCALPEGCECRRRGVSMLGVKKCLVPDINATAAELGWQVPYEVETLGEVLHQLPRAASKDTYRPRGLTLKITESPLMLVGHAAWVLRRECVWMGRIGQPVEDLEYDEIVLHPGDAARLRDAAN